MFQQQTRKREYFRLYYADKSGPRGTIYPDTGTRSRHEGPRANEEGEEGKRRYTSDAKTSFRMDDVAGRRKKSNGLYSTYTRNPIMSIPSIFSVYLSPLPSDGPAVRTALAGNCVVFSSAGVIETEARDRGNARGRIRSGLLDWKETSSGSY